MPAIRELVTRLVRELSPRIWIAIRAYASDDDHADDLLQDCWLRILEELDNYGRGGSFASWAVAVSRNLCMSRLRGRPQAGAAEVPLGHMGQLPEGTSELPSPEEVARQRLLEAGGSRRSGTTAGSGAGCDRAAPAGGTGHRGDGRSPRNQRIGSAVDPAARDDPAQADESAKGGVTGVDRSKIGPFFAGF